MRKLSLGVLVLLLPLVSVAGLKDKVYGSVDVSEITSVYDADTFRANIAGWPPVVGERMSVRVNGVDAPEMRGKCPEEKAGARRAKAHTVAALRGAQRIELRNIRRGKYFRLLADVYIDGESLAASLISAGHARPYGGGTRRGWCADR